MIGESKIPEALISQAMLKRKEWTKKYRIFDAVLFDLFSEFSSMMITKVDMSDDEETQEEKAEKAKDKARTKTKEISDAETLKERYA